MLNKYVNNNTMQKQSDDFRIKCAQLIHTMCFREIIRQVSSVCIERGLLMDKIWNSNITLFAASEEL